MTRLRIPKQLNEHLSAGDYEVLYVRPAAGELQIAPGKISLGQEGEASLGIAAGTPGCQDRVRQLPRLVRGRRDTHRRGTRLALPDCRSSLT